MHKPFYHEEHISLQCYAIKFLFLQHLFIDQLSRWGEFYIFILSFLYEDPRTLPSSLMEHSSNLVLINKHLQPKSKRKGSPQMFLSSLESQQHSVFQGCKMRGKIQNYLSVIYLNFLQHHESEFISPILKFLKHRDEFAQPMYQNPENKDQTCQPLAL